METAHRTDLAAEARELWRRSGGGDLPGTEAEERIRCGYPVTHVRITGEAAAQTLGKPKGNYVTLDLRGAGGEDTVRRAATALCEELRELLPPRGAALIVGLGNRAMTPDAIGPLCAEHILVTRHLRTEAAFASLRAVSVLIPGVLGRTGMEAQELVRGAIHAVRPEVILAVDALASQRLARLCTTVQLSDTGIVPGSGVGNHRHALDRASLGVPVVAVGVPTVVHAGTLTLDVLEEAGVTDVDPRTLVSCAGDVMVTPRDIDAQIRELARVLGYGIDLALQPTLDFDQLCQLIG